MSVVSMKQLLEAGVHFGHQTYKWNPKMKKYIFLKRKSIYILDLKQTVDAINEAYMFLKDLASKGGKVLFVGTKKQASEAIEKVAKECGSYYVNYRWYGGMITNLKTIRNSVNRMVNFEEMKEDGTLDHFTTFEVSQMRKKYEKLYRDLNGIRDMKQKPDAVFVVDTNREEIAIKEAKKLGIPVIGMVDTNCDPDLVDYVIPCNDDAIRAIYLIADIMGQAVIEGKKLHSEGKDVETSEAKEVKKEEAKEENKDEKKEESKDSEK